MTIQSLLNLNLDGCRFSKGGYTLDFSGKVNNENKRFKVSTSYNISSSRNGDDAYENISIFLWPFLDLRLVNISENKTNSEVIFTFENELSFSIWAEDDMDNLLIVKDLVTEKWSAVL